MRSSRPSTLTTVKELSNPLIYEIPLNSLHRREIIDGEFDYDESYFFYREFVKGKSFFVFLFFRERISICEYEIQKTKQNKKEQKQLINN